MKARYPGVPRSAEAVAQDVHKALTIVIGHAVRGQFHRPSAPPCLLCQRTTTPQNLNVMNKFFSLFAAAAFALASSTAFAHTTTVDADQQVTLDNATQVTYTVTVLAVHADGNRAYHASKHKSLTQAHMTYQAFVLELPDGAEVVRAEIIDSNGRVILSIG